MRLILKHSVIMIMDGDGLKLGHSCGIRASTSGGQYCHAYDGTTGQITPSTLKSGPEFFEMNHAILLLSDS